MTVETLPNSQTITLAYDDVDNLVAVTDPGGTINYAYNADDVVTSVVDRQNNSTSFQYDNNGNETLRTYPNGAAEHHSYDASGNLTRVWTTNSSGAVVTSFTYTDTNPQTNLPDVIPYTVTDASGNVTT